MPLPNTLMSISRPTCHGAVYQCRKATPFIVKIRCLFQKQVSTLQIIALEISNLYKNLIPQCMGWICSVEFAGYPTNRIVEMRKGTPRTKLKAFLKMLLRYITAENILYRISTVESIVMLLEMFDFQYYDIKCTDDFYFLLSICVDGKNLNCQSF